jgi:hypothetical protein
VDNGRNKIQSQESVYVLVWKLVLRTLAMGSDFKEEFVNINVVLEAYMLRKGKDEASIDIQKGK